MDCFHEMKKLWWFLYNNNEKEGKVQTPNGLNELPNELLMKILGYLDLPSLCQLSRVNRRFESLTSDPKYYTELDLRGLESMMHNKKMLKRAAQRCSGLYKLDISGWKDVARPVKLNRFLQRSECHLTHLIAREMETALPSCHYLRHVDLYGSKIDMNQGGYCGLLVCCHLRYLDVSFTYIAPGLLLAILRNNSALRSLFMIGPFTRVDWILETLAKYNPLLETLDLSSHDSSPTEIGVECVSLLVHLRDLRLRHVRKLEGSLIHVFKNCQQLEKLNLQCTVLTRNDVTAMADHCKKLTHLNLDGVRVVDSVLCRRLLMSLTGLQEMTIYLFAISQEELRKLQDMYPKVRLCSSRGSLH